MRGLARTVAVVSIMALTAISSAHGDCGTGLPCVFGPARNTGCAPWNPPPYNDQCLVIDGYGGNPDYNLDYYLGVSPVDYPILFALGRALGDPLKLQGFGLLDASAYV